MTVMSSWPYRPVVSHPVVRRLLPGYALSALGDAMSAVAIAWLALQLAPPASRGLWVGAAVAAYSVPGALGAAVLGRWLGHRGGVRLATADAVLRATALGVIPVLSATHTLGLAAYVGLLGVSSLLHAWGSAGQFTLVAEVLPARHRVAGNALLAGLSELSYVAGPALAGVLTVLAGPAVVIGADAVTWAVLAVSYVRVAPMLAGRDRDHDHDPSRDPDPGHDRDSGRGAEAGPPRPGAASGWRMIAASRTLLGLMALTFVFFLLYGPVEVALPVHVSDLHGSAALLGWFWAAYGAGAVAGSLAAAYLRYWPLWPTMIGIVAGWGLALVPLGLGAPLGISLAAFAVGGVTYAPYNSIAMAVFQDSVPAAMLPRVLAARAALVIVAAPLGTALGGPLVTALGARGTLLTSALTTIALALLAAAGRAARRPSPGGRPNGGRRPRRSRPDSARRGS
jgi:MFS transporter, DHA3 family, macrolide efflux protein